MESERGKEKPNRTKDETRRLLHELQLRQVELDVQNAELRHTRDELEATLDKFTDLYDFAPIGYFTLDRQGAIRAVNLSGASLLGIERSDLLGRLFLEFVPAKARPGFSEFLGRVFALQKKESLETALNPQGDAPLFVHIDAALCGSGLECRCAVSDISEKKQVADALAKSEEQYRAIVSNINEYVYSASFENNALVSTYHSPKCVDITGYSPEEYARDPHLWLSMVHENDRELVLRFLDAVYAGEKPEPIRHRIRHKNGSERWILNSCTVQRTESEGVATITRLDGFILDITELKLAEESIFFLAYHDTLTGLPNRSTLYKRITQVMTVARRTGKGIALLFLDIDGFKKVNDSLGHDVGDRVLQSVARRLKECTRYCDIVSRLGGDEFVIMLWDCGAAEATVVANKIITSGFSVPEVSAPLNASIGISLFPQDGTDYLTLLKHADVAMYHAKKSGGKKHQFFTRKLNEHARERFIMEADLRHAVERSEFVLYYQPKVDLTTGKSRSMEALIRWQHPVRGFTLPGNFIGIAEETGLLTPISKWTIRTVCRQLRQWRQQGIGPLSVAINLSATFFQQSDCEEIIESALYETGVPPECLELELTEATLMNDPDRVLGSMAAMKALGVQLSIDDFGIGYSCLNYLKKLPIDKLKIDQSFIHNIAFDTDNMAVVRAIMSIGRSMQLKVIAEGVENASQLAWLQAEGSEEAQGFYFSRPLSVNGLTPLLKQGANYLHNPRGKLRIRESEIPR
ncbi:putative bifunctional diguanylate cyclase/phosphodiesterase [Geomonas azotofigens]|uniref:putative bifunctional diguanylate cyclase/phosphodiesterase n=1 Tax=Geomonas azotofigens TaxID=2843196 RepID=UPI001C10E417|nr:GGDEF and EAL domain-containing protein [Geomonas azotofigens]MBU5614698.1 EAL domain-containing protein [Geomonas azotofigens]